MHMQWVASGSREFSSPMVCLQCIPCFIPCFFLHSSKRYIFECGDIKVCFLLSDFLHLRSIEPKEISWISLFVDNGYSILRISCWFRYSGWHFISRRMHFYFLFIKSLRIPIFKLLNSQFYASSRFALA